MMREVLYVDVRPKYENEAISRRLQKKLVIPKKFGSWSHYLINEALRGTCRWYESKLDYLNAWEDLSIPDGYDAYIIGSRGKSSSSDTDSLRMDEFLDWKAKFVELLKTQLNKKKFIGICFGHQLIGLALGLDAVKMNRSFYGLIPIDAFKFKNIFLSYHRYRLCAKQLSNMSFIKSRGIIQILIKNGFVPSVGFQFHPEYGASLFGIQAYIARYGMRSSVLKNKQKLINSSLRILDLSYDFLEGNRNVWNNCMQ